MADEEKSAGASTSADLEVKEAYDLEREIKARVVDTAEAWWHLAAALTKFKAIRGWERLGYETLEEFLQQPDIGKSRRDFFKTTQVFRDLIEVKGVALEQLRQIEPSKAIEVRPAIMAGDVGVEAALADAKELSFSDVVEKYRPSARARHGQNPDGSSKLNAASEPERVRCPCCHGWTTIDQIPEKYREEAAK